MTHAIDAVRDCRRAQKWEYTLVVYQLSIDYKKGYGTVRREVLSNIVIEFKVQWT